MAAFLARLRARFTPRVGLVRRVSGWMCDRCYAVTIPARDADGATRYGPPYPCPACSHGDPRWTDSDVVEIGPR